MSRRPDHTPKPKTATDWLSMMGDWYVPEPNTGCWFWIRGMRKEYGVFWSRGAHVWAWEFLRGPVPDGMELDHLCRQKTCVNPDHLEPVPHRVNVLRGMSPPAVNAKKTHCNRGHQLTPENVRLIKTGRACRLCERADSAKLIATQTKEGR